MLDLIAQLRRMAAVEPDQYVIGSTTYWTDDQLGAVLDRRVCARLLQAPVVKISTLNGEGTHVVLAGQITVSGVLNAETAVVIDNTGATVEDVTVHTDGRLEFETDQSSRPLMLTGLAYDLNAAAADVLTDWAAAVKEGYDLTADGQALKRSQRHAQMLEQANTFRSRAVAGTVQLHRSDVRPTLRRGRG